MRYTEPFRAVSLCIGLALILSGCTGGAGTQSFYGQILNTSIASISANRASKVERPVVTRAVLNEVEEPYIQVTRERADISAYLFASAIRQDDLPGNIVQWRAEDDVTVTMRNGVLIATRGLGGDLMSAKVPVAPGQAGPATGGERIYYVRTGDLEERAIFMACDLVDLGPETIEIVELRYATQHLQERCVTSDGDRPAGELRRGEGRIVNDYWVDQRAGIVWKSRQWAGPHIGYLGISQLTE